MGMFDFLDPGKGYKEAQKEYEKSWQQAQQYQQPYWQSGIDQISKLMGAEDMLLDPAKLQAQWAESYEMSPYAQQLQKEAQSQGMDAASSMGLLGSSAALSNIQQGASNIMNKDRQQYMNDLMEKYTTGIGIGQNMYGTGAQTGGALGGQAMNQGNRMGDAKYGESQSRSNMFKDMMNTAMRGALAYGTGGASEMGNLFGKKAKQTPEYLDPFNLFS